MKSIVRFFSEGCLHDSLIALSRITQGSVNRSAQSLYCFWLGKACRIAELRDSDISRVDGVSEMLKGQRE